MNIIELTRILNEKYSDVTKNLTPNADKLEKIAKKAFERKTGARGLRSIMEETMMDLMFQIPSDDTIQSCTITREAVEGTGEPKITRK